MGGKEKWGNRRTGIRRGERGNYLDGQHVTEFLTMFTYEWYCTAMCTCIILIVNLPPEKEGIDQFMWGRKDKQVKQHYVTPHRN